MASVSPVSEIIKLTLLVMAIIFIVKTRKVWNSMIDRLVEKAEVSQRQEGPEEKDKDEIDRHLESSMACKSGDTKKCIREAMMHPIRFTLDSHDLRGIPFDVAIQDSKVDLGVSDDDFWLSRK